VGIVDKAAAIVELRSPETIDLMPVLVVANLRLSMHQFAFLD